MQRVMRVALAALIVVAWMPAAVNSTTAIPGADAAATARLEPAPVTPLPGFDKVAPELWPATAEGKLTSLLVVLAEQADVGAAAALKTRPAKARYVYDTLRATALRSQAPLRAWLDGQAVSYQPHYLVNMLALSADRRLLLALAARPDVARLEANPTLQGVEPLPASPTRSAPGEPATVEWGVEFVGAPDVWQRYGLRGEGIVVGSQDTGVDWSHPALRSHYRGWDNEGVNHAYNWHDAIGPTAGCPDPTTPCDPHGHGTHTVGTMVGDDGAGSQIGVAPGATWIGCRNMDDGGAGTPSSYTACFEFLLAPYPFGGDPLTDGQPDLGADIVNNSWGCPPEEGCGLGTLQQVVENVRAAGTLVVAAAGNNGYACGSVIHPIATYDASFSVGAVTSTGALASFSSRGPVTVDGSNRLKPDLVAPGVGVRSAVPGGRYASLLGTSMAAPHVAGVAALLWSAAPNLVGDVDATEAILTETARHVSDATCGAAEPRGWPNNLYGWGYVDALAAVTVVREPAHVVARVSFVPCGSAAVPATGAQLTFVHGDSGVVTDFTAQTGVISATLPPGPYTVLATAPPSSVAISQTVRLLGGQDNTVEFMLPRSDLFCLFAPLVEKREP